MEIMFLFIQFSISIIMIVRFFLWCMFVCVRPIYSFYILNKIDNYTIKKNKISKINEKTIMHMRYDNFFYNTYNNIRIIKKIKRKKLMNEIKKITKNFYLNDIFNEIVLYSTKDIFIYKNKIKKIKIFNELLKKHEIIEKLKIHN